MTGRLHARRAGGILAAGAFLVTIAPRAAAAQDRLLDLELFAPAADSRGLVTVDRAELLGHLDVSFGLWASYARNPLVLVPAAGGAPYPVVRNMATGHVHAALGLFDRVEAALLVPVTILEGPRDGEAMGFGPRVAEHGLGDPSVKLKVELLDRRKHGLGLGALAAVRFPGGGRERDFMTSGGVEVDPRLLVDGAFGRVKLAANVGATLRAARPGGECCTGATGAFRVGHELTLGVGAAVELVPARLDLVVEASARLGLTGAGEARTRAPVETIAALKVYLARNSFFVVGASWGLSRLWSESYGTPEPRAFVGVTYEPLPGDRDHDGYDDGEDRCPDEPEDFDAFEDGDGCPEPDNDVDTLLDEDDACPTVAGPAENHGCPLVAERGDRDDDRIWDDADRCPDEPEDYDGFEDDDGCPDPDNDVDGLLDKDDLCPNEREDRDGFDDDDGCPDPDNDVDGFLDKDDACPNEPEDVDGDRDDDGCPDVKKVTRKGKKFEAEKIHFEHDKAVIKKESWPILFELARALEENPHVTRVRVEGHTDSDGDDAYNLRLSKARAKAVRDFLVKRAGVKPGRLVSEGFGEGKAVATNETDEGKAANRRVEFVIIKEDG